VEFADVNISIGYYRPKVSILLLLLLLLL